MQPTVPKTDVLRFGIFEVDLQSEEIRKGGLRVKLPGQSFQILRLLLQRPGELVTREELRQALWPDNHYVDFDHGLNAAVTRMRDALGDSADSPRFIETLPRRGYRFIGTLQQTNGNGAAISEMLPSVAAEAHHPFASSKKSNWGKVVAAIAVIVLLVTGIALYRRPVRVQNLAIAPFTSLPGQEVNPAFSPDGTRIVFAWDGNPPPGQRGFDLYVKEVGSEHLLRLTNLASRWLSPAWTPDGRFVVFMRSAPSERGIYIVSALGGDERLLKKDVADFNSLSLSADGRYLAYPEIVSTTGLYRIALLDMHNMAPVPISLPDCLVSANPAFAPSGHELVFACTPSWGIIDLYAIPEIGQPARRVSELLGFSSGIAWTRDQRSLIVGIERGRAALWRVDVASGKSETLLLDLQAAFPTTTQRGDRLAFSQKKETSNIWRLDLTDLAKPPVRLIASTRLEQNPHYSPDGNYLLFESSRTGFPEIWLSHSDGSEAQQLTQFGGPLTGSPRWAADSRHIVFDSRAGGRGNIYTMDINERVPHRVETNIVDNSTPSWSHDGQWIYFHSDAAGKSGLYKVSAQGGSAISLAGGEGYAPVESSDGKNLFYVDGYKFNALHRISVATGVDSIVPGLPAQGELLAWTLTPDGICFLQQLDNGAVVNFYDFAHGQIRKIVSLPAGEQPTPYTGGLSLSPDGHYLLYSLQGEQQSDIMLVDNFR